MRSIFSFFGFGACEARAEALFFVCSIFTAKLVRRGRLRLLGVCCGRFFCVLGVFIGDYLLFLALSLSFEA